MREELVQQHWDLYAHGRVTQEWAAQTYWKQQSAAQTMQAYVLGASTRKRMRLSSATSMVTALRKAMGSTAGLAERQAYRAITAMNMNMRSDRLLWGTPAKLSAIYRMWRQLLEDKMHVCLMRWMSGQ